MAKSLYEMIQPNVFMIPAAKAAAIAQLLNLKTDDLLQQLVPLIKQHAVPPISKYFVGAVVLGKSGNIYLGVNLEFSGSQLNNVIHGEQFAIINARNHGETEIIAIALSAAPCGHCRQFLNEIGKDIKILTPNTPPENLSSLLPKAFGPNDLGMSGNLLSSTEKPDALPPSSLLKRRATEALHASYAPYTQSPSGVAIRTYDGNIYVGSYLENAAYNPSVSPLQAALVSLIVDQRSYSEISEVVLLEKDISNVKHSMGAKEILAQIAPQATFTAEVLESEKARRKIAAKM